MLYHISTLNLYPTTPSPLLCINHSFAPLQSINNHNHSGYGILLDIIVVSPAALSTIITPPCSLSHIMHAIRSFHIPLPVSGIILGVLCLATSMGLCTRGGHTAKLGAAVGILFIGVFVLSTSMRISKSQYNSCARCIWTFCFSYLESHWRSY